jgi:hypothetical protein
VAILSVRRRREPSALTAAVYTPSQGRGERAVVASAARASDAPRSNQGQRVPQWQMDALAYYDQIGPVRYAAQFTARALGRLRWYAAFKDDNGEVQESEDPQLNALWDRVQDPDGGRQTLMATYAQLRFLTGECYLLWSQETSDEPERWEICSMLELRKGEKRSGRETWRRITAPGLTPQQLFEADEDDFDPLGDAVQVWRLWRRHPAYSMMADSPMRAVLAECEEIVRATHSINARLISRLAGPGIFAIPHSWLGQPLQQVVGSENPQEHPFQKRLTDAMVAAINKPGSAEQVAPIVVVVPSEETDRGKLYKIHEPNEVIRELDLREKAIHRFAVGVDMPPSKVEGMEGSSHWNAWIIDEDSWRHIEPEAGGAAEDFASAYLRPAARQAGVANWENVVIGYDSAGVVQNPDSLKDALELYDRRIVGKAYVREAGDATDEDAMKNEELAEAIFVETKQKVEVQGDKVILDPDEPEPVVVAGPVPPGQDPPPNGRPPSGEDTPRGAPPEPEAVTGSAFRILGAAEAAVEEIRSRVGSRLRNHLQGRCADCLVQIEGVESSAIASVLGPELVAANGPGDLVSLAIGGSHGFQRIMRRNGVTEAQAAALGEVLELHAVATIFDFTPTLPVGFMGRVRALEMVAS